MGPAQRWGQAVEWTPAPEAAPGKAAVTAPQVARAGWVPLMSPRTSGTCAPRNTSGLSKGALGPQEVGWQAQQPRQGQTGILEVSRQPQRSGPPGRWVHIRGWGESSRRTLRPRPPEAWPWWWGPWAAAAPGWWCMQGTAWRSSSSAGGKGGGKGRLETGGRSPGTG